MPTFYLFNLSWVCTRAAGAGQGELTCHDGRSRVGAVSGDGDDADVAVVVAVGLVVGADGHEARVLAGRPAVGLQRYRVKARDLCQLRRQVLLAEIAQTPSVLSVNREVHLLPAKRSAMLDIAIHFQSYWNDSCH